jgi:hypothetical protein
MFVVAAAGLTQARAAVTLAGETLREDEAMPEIFCAVIKLILNFTFS